MSSSFLRLSFLEAVFIFISFLFKVDRQAGRQAGSPLARLENRLAGWFAEIVGKQIGWQLGSLARWLVIRSAD